MSPRRQESLDLILAIQERYSAYHSSKEGRIWVAAVLLIGLLVSIGFHDYAEWRAGEVFLVLIALAGSLVIATEFLRRQYRLREHAAFMTQACENVLVKYRDSRSLTGKKQMMPELLLPHAGRQADVWLPAVVLEEYREQEKANKGKTWNERGLVMAVVTILGIVASLHVLFAWVSKVS